MPIPPDEPLQSCSKMTDSNKMTNKKTKKDTKPCNTVNKKTKNMTIRSLQKYFKKWYLIILLTKT